MDLRTFVAENATWFRGVAPETEITVTEAEHRLGVSLPASLKWLLCEHGYSLACGVANLGEAVEMTLSCRESLGLPTHYVLLQDKGDAGVVLLDARSQGGRVSWIGAHAIRQFIAGGHVEDIDDYPDFALWISRCLEDAKEIANE